LQLQPAFCIAPFAIALLNLFRPKKDKCPKLSSKLLLLFEEYRYYFGKRNQIVDELNVLILSEL
jgi:hypothetical protein